MNVSYKKIIVSIKYEQSAGKTYQHFVFKLVNKKFIDPKFLMYHRLKKRVLELALPNEFFVFEELRELSDRFTVVYNNIGCVDDAQLADSFYTLADYIPPESCKFCKYKVEEKNGLHCEVKNKDYLKNFKKCKYFSQREAIFKP